MKKKKILIAILACLILISSGINTFAEMVDIKDHWARREIVYLTNKEIIAGYEDETFKPDEAISNVEFYKIVNGLAGVEEVKRPRFKDIKRNDWFYKELGKALYLGYIDNGGYIQPNETIERQEVARILAFVYDLKLDARKTRDFKDRREIDLSKRSSVGAMARNGYIRGYEDGEFKPKDHITRAEVAKMIYNIMRDKGRPIVRRDEEEIKRDPIKRPVKINWENRKSESEPNLKIKEIEAVSEDTILVYFENITLPSRIKLENQKFVDGWNKVRFNYKGEEYTDMVEYVDKSKALKDKIEIEKEDQKIRRAEESLELAETMESRLLLEIARVNVEELKDGEIKKALEIRLDDLENKINKETEDEESEGKKLGQLP